MSNISYRLVLVMYCREAFEQCNLFRLIIYSILSPIVASFGLFGNLFILFVLKHQDFNTTKRGSLFGYMRFLAFSDSAYLFTTLFLSYFLSYDSDTTETESTSFVLWNAIIPLCNAFRGSSDFIVIYI